MRFACYCTPKRSSIECGNRQARSSFGGARRERGSRASGRPARGWGLPPGLGEHLWRSLRPAPEKCAAQHGKPRSTQRIPTSDRHRVGGAASLLAPIPASAPPSLGESMTQSPPASASSPVGLGLLPQRDDVEHHAGHVWITWQPLTAEDARYRGYYPDFTAIPDEFRDAPETWLEFFSQNSVPGYCINDSWARELATSMRTRHWALASAHVLSLETACFIPRGSDGVLSGRYSWNEAAPTEHNCSSWALHQLNSAAKSDLVVCTRPKRLRHVEQVLSPQMHHDAEHRPMKRAQQTIVPRRVTSFASQEDRGFFLDLADAPRAVCVSPNDGHVLLHEGSGDGRLNGVCIPGSKVLRFEIERFAGGHGISVWYKTPSGSAPDHAQGKGLAPLR